jgi:hypothetical protein
MELESNSAPRWLRSEPAARGLDFHLPGRIGEECPESPQSNGQWPNRHFNRFQIQDHRVADAKHWQSVCSLWF